MNRITPPDVLQLPAPEAPAQHAAKGRGNPGKGNGGKGKGRGAAARPLPGIAPGLAPLPAGAAGRAHRGVLPKLGAEFRPDTPALRAERVEAIRRDLVRRRRRQGLAMLARLAVFVALPTLAVAVFLWGFATPLYRSEAVLTVQSAESGGAPGSAGLMGLLGGAAAGPTHDSVAVQNFILSRDMLRLLDVDHDLTHRMKDPGLDVFHRLSPDAGTEAAFAHYLTRVTAGFDPAEGVIALGVVGASPGEAQGIAQTIIAHAEAMVDRLAARIRRDRLDLAEQHLAEAEARLRAAHLAAAESRKTLATFSVDGEASAQMGIIADLETRRDTLRARRAGLERVTAPNDPRLGALAAQEATLTEQIEQRRDGLAGTADTGTLADINARMQRANADIVAATAIFDAAIAARETARAEAGRQHRYLAVVVRPSRPDAPNSPARFRSTGLAFLGFLGLYIMASLTISLIREQASM